MFSQPPPPPVYRDEDEGSIILSLISQLRCAPPPPISERPTDKFTQTPTLLWPQLPFRRVGMDLSKVTLPTFVLEPRSMLERITDFMAHPDLIFGCVLSSPHHPAARTPRMCPLPGPHKWCPRLRSSEPAFAPCRVSFLRPPSWKDC